MDHLYTSADDLADATEELVASLRSWTEEGDVDLSGGLSVARHVLLQNATFSAVAQALPLLESHGVLRSNMYDGMLRVAPQILRLLLEMDSSTPQKRNEPVWRSFKTPARSHQLNAQMNSIVRERKRPRCARGPGMPIVPGYNATLADAGVSLLDNWSLEKVCCGYYYQ